MDPFGRRYPLNTAREDGGRKDCSGTCGYGLKFKEAQFEKISSGKGQEPHHIYLALQFSAIYSSLY